MNFEVRERRGKIILLSPPSPRNGYAAVVRIRDNAAGAGRYHFRLSWRSACWRNDDGRGYGNRPGRFEPPPRSVFGMNDARRVCHDAVIGRIVNQYRFGDVDIRNVLRDDRSGRRDVLVGEAIAPRAERTSIYLRLRDRF